MNRLAHHQGIHKFFLALGLALHFSKLFRILSFFWDSQKMKNDRKCGRIKEFENFNPN